MHLYRSQHNSNKEVIHKGTYKPQAKTKQPGESMDPDTQDQKKANNRNRNRETRTRQGSHIAGTWPQQLAVICHYVANLDKRKPKGTSSKVRRERRASSR